VCRCARCCAAWDDVASTTSADDVVIPADSDHHHHHHCSHPIHHRLVLVLSLSLSLSLQLVTGTLTSRPTGPLICTIHTTYAPRLTSSHPSRRNCYYHQRWTWVQFAGPNPTLPNVFTTQRNPIFSPQTRPDPTQPNPTHGTQLTHKWTRPMSISDYYTVPFYGHYTGQPLSAGNPIQELEDFVPAKFYCRHDLAGGN